MADMTSASVPPPAGGGVSFSPLGGETLKKAMLAGLVAGLLGAFALLFADVEPTIEFFAIMGVAVGILSFIVDSPSITTGGTESDPTYG